MNYQKMTIMDMSEKDPEKLFKEANTLAHQYQEEYNSFVTILDTFDMTDGKTKLRGIPYALKDNIATKGILTTASSNILKDYVPVFDATVYKKLKESGAVLVGKTVLDELAMGGTGTTGHTGIVKNPWDKTRQIGGSSAGSAAAVALGIVPFSIGSDTGDSIRKPAAYGGIVGFKPTYGLVSRYGLFPFASSLDHVGCFTRSVKDAAIVTDIIKGYDENDMTSLKDDGKCYESTIEQDIHGRKLFYIKEICDKNLYQGKSEILSVLDSFYDNLKKLEEIGFEIEPVSIDKDLLMALYPTYMAITCAEATSNDSNLTGISFGIRGEGKNIQEMIMDARTKGFSELIKRRFVLGSYILQRENQEKLFLNAQRIRHMIVDKINTLFQEFDGMIMPSFGSLPPKFEDSSDRLSEEYLLLENHLCIGNFGGFPSISIPSGFLNNLPLSINLTGRCKEDDLVLNMAYYMEKTFGYQGIVAGGEDHV